jgi:hypothetical protein
MLNIDAGVQFIKLQGVVRNPRVVLSENLQIASHGFSGIVAFRDGNAD